MAADGNCFFRALSDQRWGGDSHHAALRRDVVEYMKKNREAFEPFIEDDEKWDTYVARMSEDGAWAGNVELQAASVVCFANLCVHQAGQPRWEITNYPNADRFFHVAYQDGDHYNSVRLAAEDFYSDTRGAGSSPGGPISLAGLSDPAPRLAERPRLGREPSGGAVAETVARAGGAGEEVARARAASRVRRVRRQRVDSARAEVSYKGALRGGAGDDPAPGERETEGGADRSGGRASGGGRERRLLFGLGGRLGTRRAQEERARERRATSGETKGS